MKKKNYIFKFSVGTENILSTQTFTTDAKSYAEAMDELIDFCFTLYPNGFTIVEITSIKISRRYANLTNVM